MEREAVNRALETMYSLSPWLTTLVLSFWAAIVQYIQKVRNGAKWSWKELTYDITICSFVGIITKLLCDYANIDGPLSGVLIAVSAHMGTRALITYESFRNRVLGLEPKVENGTPT